jgi:transcriptional regulator with XRE-family HTH domain
MLQELYYLNDKLCYAGLPDSVARLHWKAAPEFVEDMRYLSRVLGLTSAQLARSLNVSKSGLSRWESGRRPPTLAIYRKVREWAKVLREAETTDTLIKHTQERYW